MTDEELLESLDRHFLLGNAGLTAVQVRQHRDRGSCVQCDAITLTVAATEFLKREVAKLGLGEVPPGFRR